MNLFFIVLVLSTGSSYCQETCCPAPFSMFAISTDLANLFPGITANLSLVTGGTVDSLIQLNSVTRTFYAGNEVTDFPFILVANAPNVFIDFIITSEDTSVLLTPVLLPYSEGLVPTEPQRFHLTFECTGITTELELEVVTVNISASNNRTGEVYCPLFFNFGKQCLERNSITPEEELEYMETDYVSNISIPNYVGCNRTITDTPPIDVDKSPLIPIISSLLPLTVIIVITISIGVILWIIRYKTLKSQRHQLLQLETVGQAYLNKRDVWIPSRTPHEKEFPPNKLVLKRELGEGAFGSVYEGEADGIIQEGIITPVAVKQLLNSSAQDEFFREVSFMSKLKHDKVISLLGVCGLEEPFAMIFEYMDLGDLCSFLRDAALLRDETIGADILTTQQLVHIALQVAEGMEYIASTKLVHRDLAARNCLVATGLVIKIADFGLSRNLYSTDYYRVQGSTLLPVRWMSPESIQYGKFSEASDVYSFGILLWEIFTFGEQPYAGHTNEEVIEMIIKKTYLAVPANCPVQEVIDDCWVWKPKERPNFKELRSHLKTLLHDLTV